MNDAAIVIPILWKWVLAFCGGVSAIAAAGVILYKVFIKPWKDLIARVEALENKHEDDQKQNEDRFKKDLDILKAQGDMLKQLCHGVMVLLDHAATGNNVDGCKNARDELRDYMIDK